MGDVIELHNEKTHYLSYQKYEQKLTKDSIAFNKEMEGDI